MAPSESDALVELDIPRNGARPIVIIESLGEKLRFLVDSTFATTTYDAKWRPQLGAALRTAVVRNINGATNRMACFRAPPLRLGPLRPRLDEVTIAGMRQINLEFDQPIDGVLGLDVLRQFVVTVNCDKGVLQLRTSLHGDPGEEVPLALEEFGPPTVPVALGGMRPTPFAICTGSMVALLLRPPVFAELREKGAIRSTNPTIGVRELGYGGSTGIANDVALGSFVHGSIAAEAWSFDGLGMDYLSRYVVTLDFPRRKAYFKPGKAIDRIDRLDQSGLHIVKREEQVAIDHVAANSPGWESGILIGDVLRRINDKPISEFSLFELRRLLQAEGSQVAIVVGRDGEPLGFRLALRNYEDAAAEAKRRIARRLPVDALPPVAAVIAEFDVGRRGEPLVVPVAIDGIERSLKMLVDTGSARTVFNERMRAKLGKGVGWERMQSPDGLRAIEQIRVAGATLGGVRLSNASTGLVDDISTELFRKHFGYDDLDGILGMDLLSGQIVQIDFDAGKLRLLSAVGNDCGNRVEFVYRPSGTPALSTTLGSIGQRWFIADTGCACWNFCDENVFSLLSARDEVQEIHPAFVLDNSGPTIRKDWRVKSMGIGPFGHTNVGFASAQVNALGLLYLSRYLVTFDFPGGAIYLKKGELYDRPEPYDVSGLHIIKRDGEYVVLDVSPGSSANDVGVIAGDVILGVGGQDVMKYSLFELSEILSDGGKTVPLSLRRGSNSIELELLLREYFGDRSPKKRKPSRSPMRHAKNEKNAPPVR